MALKEGFLDKNIGYLSKVSAVIMGLWTTTAMTGCSATVQSPSGEVRYPEQYNSETQRSSYRLRRDGAGLDVFYGPNVFHGVVSEDGNLEIVELGPNQGAAFLVDKKTRTTAGPWGDFDGIATGFNQSLEPFPLTRGGQYYQPLNIKSPDDMTYITQAGDIAVGQTTFVVVNKKNNFFGIFYDEAGQQKTVMGSVNGVFLTLNNTGGNTDIYQMIQQHAPSHTQDMWGPGPNQYNLMISRSVTVDAQTGTVTEARDYPQVVHPSEVIENFLNSLITKTSTRVHVSPRNNNAAQPPGTMISTQPGALGESSAEYSQSRRETVPGAGFKAQKAYTSYGVLIPKTGYVLVELQPGDENIFDNDEFSREIRRPGLFYLAPLGLDRSRNEYDVTGAGALVSVEMDLDGKPFYKVLFEFPKAALPSDATKDSSTRTAEGGILFQNAYRNRVVYLQQNINQQPVETTLAEMLEYKGILSGAIILDGKGSREYVVDRDNDNTSGWNRTNSFHGRDRSR